MTEWYNMVEYIYTCNVCGKRIPQKEAEDHPSAYYYGRYSFHDGERVNIDFCFSCFDNLIKSCKINPVEDNDDYGYEPEQEDLFNDNGDSCEEPESQEQNWNLFEGA